MHKAGWLVGLADCYAVIVLDDDATFLLAANRIAAFRSYTAIMLCNHQLLWLSSKSIILFSLLSW